MILIEPTIYANLYFCSSASNRRDQIKAKHYQIEQYDREIAQNRESIRRIEEQQQKLLKQ